RLRRPVDGEPTRDRGADDHPHHAVLLKRCGRLGASLLVLCKLSPVVSASLRCRPRESGDPYSRGRWLWVPACAGTTVASLGEALPQSALIPGCRIGSAQRSISSGRNLARYSGVRRSGGTISRPSSSSRLRIAGSSMASLIALLSLRTIGSGGPLRQEK